MEMATRIHRQPALADAKFAQMAASIREIMPWFETGYHFVKRQSQSDPNVWVSLGDPRPAPLTAASKPQYR